MSTEKSLPELFEQLHRIAQREIKLPEAVALIRAIIAEEEAISQRVQLPDSLEDTSTLSKLANTIIILLAQSHTQELDPSTVETAGISKAELVDMHLQLYHAHAAQNEHSKSLEEALIAKKILEQIDAPEPSSAQYDDYIGLWARVALMVGSAYRNRASVEKDWDAAETDLRESANTLLEMKAFLLQQKAVVSPKERTLWLQHIQRDELKTLTKLPDTSWQLLEQLLKDFEQTQLVAGEPKNEESRLLEAMYHQTALNTWMEIMQRTVKTENDVPTHHFAAMKRHVEYFAEKELLRSAGGFSSLHRIMILHAMAKYYHTTNQTAEAKVYFTTARTLAEESGHLHQLEILNSSPLAKLFSDSAEGAGQDIIVT